MKLQHLLLVFTFSFAAQMTAQINNAFNYQALIRNNQGVPQINVSVNCTVDIMQGSSSVYSETNGGTTDSFGLVTLRIGRGNPLGIGTPLVLSDFSKIKWGYLPSNLRLTMLNGTVINSPILASPIALYAEKSLVADTAKFALSTLSDWQKIRDTILYTDKRIGIGTTTPTAMLNVYPKGSGGILIGNPSTGNGGFSSLYMGITADTSGRSYLQSIRSSGSAWGDLNLNPQGGNVGIGTNNPGSKLVVAGTTEIKSDGTTWPALVFTNTAGRQKYFEMPPSGAMYLFDRQNGNYDTYWDNAGKVGIGTSNPQAKLHVNGTTQTEGLRLNGSDFQMGLNDNRNKGSKPDQRALVNDLNDVLVLNYAGDFEGAVRVDSDLRIAGTTSTAILEVRGADITEKAENTEGVEVGEVVVIDPTKPNHVRRSHKAYDKTVVGVVSGAGGISHGMQLAQAGVLDGNTAFAIAGRVYVKVTGKVEVGDLLTTSDKAGYAMTAADPIKSIGTVIGKAWSLPNAEGLVLMLVIMR